MNDAPILALSFAITTTISLIALGTLLLFRSETEAGAETPPAPRILGIFTPIVGGLLPISGRGREQLQKLLLQAGYFEPVAADNFQAVRSLMTYAPLTGGIVGSLLTELPWTGAFLLLAIVGGGIGFFLPRIVLQLLAERRSERIRRGLPMLMDTLGLTLSTGASLPRAMSQSGEALRRGHPDLSREVRLVLAQSELRSLADALDRWKHRQPLPELGSLVFLLGQADRFGTDITRGLWELSASLQVNARQRAEAAANRANFYLAFPTVLCLMIAAGLILAGPGIVQIVKTNQRVQEILKEAEGQESLVKKQVPLPGVTVPSKNDGSTAPETPTPPER